jgi:hypothetical protein
MRIIESIDVWWPVWVAGAVVLAMTDRVSWWVVLLVVGASGRGTVRFRK